MKSAMRLLVTGAALFAATLSAAQLLDMEKDLGTVEPGKIADLVAVPGDPLADIKLMTQVTFVMKAGAVYKPAASR